MNCSAAIEGSEDLGNLLGPGHSGEDTPIEAAVPISSPTSDSVADAIKVGELVKTSEIAVINVPAAPAASIPKIMATPSDLEHKALDFSVKVIQIVGGIKSQVNVNASETLLDLSRKISKDRPEAKMNKQILVYKQHVLTDEDESNTLEHYSIGKAAKIYLILKEHGKGDDVNVSVCQWKSDILASEIKYDKANKRALKKSSSPDVSIVFVDKTLRMQTSGSFRIDIKVAFKGDEMWIGLTDDFAALRGVNGAAIRHHRNIWAYCDGSRVKNITCEGTKLATVPQSYTSGDTIGLEINWTAKQMHFYKNNTRQASCPLPSRPSFMPFAALDYKDDCVEVVRCIEVASK